MKKLFSLGVLAGATILLAGCGTAPLRGPTGTTDRPVGLQITVEVPPTMSVLVQEDVAEAFAQRVSTALHEQGLGGRIDYVGSGGFQRMETPMLAIQLREWRVDAEGNVDCTFTADLRTLFGTRRLGAFTGSAMMRWSRPNWIDRDRDFDEAARDALGNLGQRLLDTGLLSETPLR